MESSCHTYHMQPNLVIWVPGVSKDGTNIYGGRYAQLMWLKAKFKNHPLYIEERGKGMGLCRWLDVTIQMWWLSSKHGCMDHSKMMEAYKT